MTKGSSDRSDAAEVDATCPGAGLGLRGLEWRWELPAVAMVDLGRRGLDHDRLGATLCPDVGSSAEGGRVYPLMYG